jgi:ubiquinone/menaquinone biosynthesis C-methylase UbiE
MESHEITFTKVDRPLSQAKAYYTRLSRIYDWLAASEKRFIRQGLDMLDPQPGERILEIGFGTGYAQKRIIQDVADGLSAGLDLSDGMGRISKINLTKAGLEDDLALLISDTLPMPCRSNIFDGVFSSFTLELFDTPQIPEILKECQRVLRPGGRMVVVSLSKDAPLTMIARIYERLHVSFPSLLDCRPIPVLQIFNKAGFRIHQNIQTKMWGLPVIIVEAILDG